MEPKTSDMPVAGTESGRAPQGGRLLVASRLATALSRASSVESVAAEAVRTLHESFDYYLAVVQRLDPDGVLRVVALEGPSAAEVEDLLARGQRVEVGVNGRVARTGRPAMVNDTRLDPDYLGRADGDDPGSELALPIVVAESNWGVMNLEQRERGAFGEEDLLLAHVVAGQIGAAIHRCQLVGELEDAFLTTVGLISDAVEMQDSYTATHAEEVSDLAVRVGERMGIGGVELDRLRYGALLHDVGKISIPAEIIRKRGPLTPAERARMNEHAAIGARMLERIPFLAPVAPLVRSAHERHDGAGYPDGLDGEAIPRGAMVIATCDAFHAMTSDRSYRKAMNAAAAEAELRANRGTQFRPEVVDALLAELAERPSPAERAAAAERPTAG
ncbi:MAG TPA: HD domain-containing phosphohydrolase [Solirubrobacterales bacterium]